MALWRFIDSGLLGGASNMAVDEALLACFDPERSLPILRIYGWEPPALSLGRFQKAHEVLDRERCGREGVVVVRRITGGGVIYHGGELTYSLVCAPHHLPPVASIKESFRVLTSFIMRFYAGLGMVPRYALDDCPAGAALGERTPFCFAGRESYDIMIDGRKIGGNAQRRLKRAIFQHGSIPVENHIPRGAAFLRDPPAGIGEKSGALRDLGVESSLGMLRARLADAFRESFAATFREEGLSAAESAQAASLHGKHASFAWTWEGVDERTNR
ncbi:MAG TPA: lipoate--protein ligase family protein [Geobacteraceae bacterium]